MSHTMAESFCAENLMNWSENGQDFTDWRDEGIFVDSVRMNRYGAISLFYPRDEDRVLIVTMFHDRSWIVQPDVIGGTPPELGTAEDDHRILDFIHRTLETMTDDPMGNNFRQL